MTNMILTFVLGLIAGPVLLFALCEISDRIDEAKRRKRIAVDRARWEALTCARCGYSAAQHIYRMVEWDPFNSYHLCVRVEEVDGYQYFQPVAAREEEAA